MIGHADPSSLATREHQRATILLAGRAWGVRDVDWQRRTVWVEPVDEPGRSRWMGPGGSLSIEVCHSIRSVLPERAHPDGLSARGHDKFGEITEKLWWVEEGATTLESGRDQTKWWTFGGARANTTLEFCLREAGLRASGVDDLSVSVVGLLSATQLNAVFAGLDPAGLRAPVDLRRLEDVKFSVALPVSVGSELVQLRDLDVRGVRTVLAEPVVTAQGR